MANNSIFELADKFGYNSPFGDWVKEDFKPNVEQTLFLQFVKCQVDNIYYHISFNITAINLKTTTGIIELYESDITNYTSDFVKKFHITNITNTGKSNCTIRVGKNEIASLSTFFEGSFEFFAKLSCGNISAQTEEFALSNNAVQAEETKLIQNNKANPFGNNLYIAFVGVGATKMKQVASQAQQILDKAEIMVQVSYFDLAQLDSIFNQQIIERNVNYLAQTDGLVFVGDGSSIDSYIVLYLEDNDKEYRKNDDIFHPLSMGDTRTCKVLASQKKYQYSAYEAVRFDEKRYNGINTQQRNLYLSRGIIHEWVHQILLNNNQNGEGHSQDVTVKPGVRYSNIAIKRLKEPNIMWAGGYWGIKGEEDGGSSLYYNDRHDLSSTLFHFLEIDIDNIKAALGSKSVPVRKELIKQNPLIITSPSKNQSKWKK